MGVNIPERKHINIALTEIYGIGYSLSCKICLVCNLSPIIKVKNLKDEQLELLRKEIVKYQLEGNLRRNVAMSIKRLIDLGVYRGKRHRRRLPVRGQRTKTNARTRKKM